MSTVAPLPSGITAKIDLPDPYTGWTATVRRSLPLSVLVDFQKGDDNPEQFQWWWDKVVIEHNFPATDGTLAKGALDVADFLAVRKLVELWVAMISTVPSP